MTPNKLKTHAPLAVLSLALAGGLAFAIVTITERDKTIRGLVAEISHTESNLRDTESELETAQKSLEDMHAQLTEANDALDEISIALASSRLSYYDSLNALQDLQHSEEQLRIDLDEALVSLFETQNTVDEITAVAIEHRDRINTATTAISNGLIWVKSIPSASYYSGGFTMSTDPYEKLRVKYNDLVDEHNDLVQRFNAAVERSNDLSDIINDVSNALNY